MSLDATISRTRSFDPLAMDTAHRAHLAEAIFPCHEAIFEGVSRTDFTAYVVDSKADWTRIQVYYDAVDRPVGYTAIHRFDVDVDGRSAGVFRFEFGLRPEYRGNTACGPFVARHMVAARLRWPTRPLYVFANLVHPSSYTFIDRYCSAYWPRMDRPTPPEITDLMGRLRRRFGARPVDPEDPSVVHVGWRTRQTGHESGYWRRKARPPSRWFVERNPGYLDGHGLVTMVRVDFEVVGRGLVRWGRYRTLARRSRTGRGLQQVRRATSSPGVRSS